MFKDSAIISKISVKFVTLSIIFIILGCAVGDPFNDSKDKIPTLKPDMARIFVYRSFNPFALIRPLMFKLDGENIADSYASTIFYHDITPGKHVVNMGTTEDDLSFNIAAGKTRYLRFSIVSDAISKANYIIESIDNKTAAIELDNIRLIEKNNRYPDEAK